MDFIEVDYEKIKNMNDKELHAYTLNKMIDLENEIVDEIVDVTDREDVEKLLNYRDKIHFYIYEMGTFLGLDNYKNIKDLKHGKNIRK